MQPAQLRIFQAFADLAIPLTGYLLLGWGFYFILLYFLLDHVAFCILSFIKVRRIAEFHGESHPPFPVRQLLLTLLLTFAALAATYPALLLTHPSFDLAKETWDFIIYTEPGIPIPQGILLIPLMAFGTYQQYKLHFLLPGRYANMSAQEIWKQHFVTLYVVLGCAALFTGTSYLIVFPATIYILILIFGVAAYRFLYARV